MEIDEQTLLRIEDLAHKATPGLWKNVISHPHMIVTDKNDFNLGNWPIGEIESYNDAAYIAAVSPKVLLALIKYIKGLHEVNDPQALIAAYMAGALDKGRADRDKIEFLERQIGELEKEADWLAEYGAGKEQCPFFEFQYGDAEPIPDWCEGSETAEDGFDCPNDPTECWRKLAREKRMN